MNKYIIMIVSFMIGSALHACLNTISNNTQHSYKIVEIKDNSADEKGHTKIDQVALLPDEYINDEFRAHTILPGEEFSLGGHYVPTFVIFKEYPDKQWRSMLLVEQLRCGPRGPENKYLLMTDLLKRQLPGDYQDVYKFTLKKEPSELEDFSVNAPVLEKIENKYQVVLNLLDDLTQKVQELMSQELQHEKKLQKEKK